MKVPSHYVIATFQLYGSLMLESPDYFFRVREIGRLRQTTGLLGQMFGYGNFGRTRSSVRLVTAPGLSLPGPVVWTGVLA